MDAKRVVRDLTLRVEASLGRMPAAVRLGVTPSALSNWKAGTSMPSAEKLLKLQDLAKRSASTVAAFGAGLIAVLAGEDGRLLGPGWTTATLINWTQCVLCKAERRGPTAPGFA